MKKLFLILFLLCAIPALGTYEFDGVDDNVKINTQGTSLNNICGTNSVDGVTGCTVTAWIYPYSQGEVNRGIIIKKTDEINNPTVFTLSFKDTTAMSLRFFYGYGSTGLNQESNNNAVVINQWQHVATTYHTNGGLLATNVKIYVNGNEVSSYQNGTNGSGSAHSDAAGTFAIGNNPFTVNSTFHGKISQLKLYTRVLSENEIKNTALSKLRFVGPSCVADWEFDELGDGVSVSGTGKLRDYSGNGNTGTATGSPTSSTDNNLSYP